jgi:hypothetical protein
MERSCVLRQSTTRPTNPADLRPLLANVLFIFATRSAHPAAALARGLTSVDSSQQHEDHNLFCTRGGVPSAYSVRCALLHQPYQLPTLHKSVAPPPARAPPPNRPLLNCRSRRMARPPRGRLRRLPDQVSGGDGGGREERVRGRVRGLCGPGHARRLLHGGALPGRLGRLQPAHPQRQGGRLPGGHPGPGARLLRRVRAAGALVRGGGARPAVDGAGHVLLPHPRHRGLQARAGHHLE